MPLVNYSDSDSDSDSGSGSGSSHEARLSQPPAKKQRTALNKAATVPPLPPNFLDLYASSVRTSAVDDPALHQGRKRQIPHVAGNWPSHLYIEWHPTTQQHHLLASLLKRITPLLLFNTAQKDRFLDAITADIQASRMLPVLGLTKLYVLSFMVSPYRLYWYTSPDSARTFLVLSVSSLQSFGQPALYALKDQESAKVDIEANISGTASVDSSAFHVSIAWTFDVPSQEVKQRSCAFFDNEFSEVKDWKLDVGSVKAKIGNIITTILLGDTSATPDSLFM
ncbi:U6 snRNA phosphodiesterase [Ceratocystis platani]|uniref:U6 snRNA phosphodiesterase 1 n=1 Tax=Ceratocystis fimbriata f. sp. platani TaxID=88771 RepID=A0A0F8DN08_CERFI|nr:U6 snRNA phosphodiesterase [Ceratocystis platani]